MPHARLRSVALLAVATLGLAGCASTPAAENASESAPETITVTHAQGETEVPTNPEKVVVFDLASLDTLDALGVEPIGVPEAVLPDYLSDYADTTKVGSLFEPDYEAVAELEPDLIIVAARSAEALPELEKIAPTIDMSVDWTDYLAQFTTGVETLASIFGKEDEAEEALTAIEDKIADTRALTEDAGRGLVLSTSAGELTANGLESRYGWLHAELGVTPAVENVEESTHGDPVSPEFVLETNPDWLFVLDRDAAVGEQSASAEELLDNEIIAQTTAWQQGNVVYLSPSEWYVVMYGLTAVDTMVDEIHDALSA